jgi:fructose-1,6-bisphosphatase
MEDIINRTQLINDTIYEIYGRFVPQLYWNNYKSIVFNYDSESDSFVTGDGISLKVDIPNDGINLGSIHDFLDKYKAYVQEQFKSKYNIDLDYDW